MKEEIKKIGKYWYFRKSFYWEGCSETKEECLTKLKGVKKR